MSPDASQDSSPHAVVRALRSINEYAASVVLLIYVVGFIVTNLYLGSLGIVNIDVLRLRYILSGVLFVIFLGCVALPLQGLRTILSTNHQVSSATKLMRAARYTFRAFMAVFFVVLVLAALSSTPERRSIGIPSVSPPLPFSAWTAHARANLPSAAMKSLGFMVFAALLFAVLVFGPAVVGIISRRLWTLNDVKDEILRVFPNWKRVLGALMALASGYATVIAAVVVTSLVDFLASNRLSFIFQTSDGSCTSCLGFGWGRFIIAAFAFYAFLALILIPFQMTSSRGAKNTDVDTSPIWGQHFKPYEPLSIPIVWVLLILIPTYSVGIYPYLPSKSVGEVW